MPIRVASTFRARLVGLALRSEPPDWALLLPRTRAVHTFGMRFCLDLYWLDASGGVIRVDRAVAPRRLRACRRARAVLERPAPPTPENDAGPGVRRAPKVEREGRSVG